MITHDGFLSLLDELDFGSTLPRDSLEDGQCHVPALPMLLLGSLSLLLARARWPVALALMTPYINYENHIYK